MKKRLLSMVLIFAAVATVFADNKWELSKNKDGVAVYTREIPGSSMKEFMGIIEIDSPVEVVGLVLLDVANHKAWIADCTESRIVKDVKGNLGQMPNFKAIKLIQYYVVTAPWPVKYRDMVLMANADVDFEKGKMVINTTAMTEQLVAPKEGCVRITDMYVKWVIEKTGPKKTKVTYIVKSNPGGSIPSSVANWSSSQLPYKTLVALRGKSKDAKYVGQAKGMFKNLEI